MKPEMGLFNASGASHFPLIAKTEKAVAAAATIMGAAEMVDKMIVELQLGADLHPPLINDGYIHSYICLYKPDEFPPP